MRTTIKATNIEHTNAIDSYLLKRLSELEKILDPKEESEVARVNLGKTTKHHKAGREVYYAEISMYAHKKKFCVLTKADDLYAAIDKMKDEIVREVKEHHGRLRQARKKGAREIKDQIKKG